MKLILPLFLALVVSCSANQEAEQNHDTAPATSHLSDTTTYHVGLIKSAPDRTDLPEDKIQEIQQAHLDNIFRLADLGLMALAGPFWTDDNSNEIRGLFFYRCSTAYEADTLAATDPAVMQGRLLVENHPWLGSGAMAYDTIDGGGGMRGYQACLFWLNDSIRTQPSYRQLYDHQTSAVSKLCDSGRVVLAGPFTDCTAPGDPFAMLIYSADSLGTITRAVADAPGVADSSLTTLVINWYGPVGLRE